MFDAESEKDLKEWRETMQNVQLKLFAGDAEVGKGELIKTTNVDILLCVCVCVQESTLHRQRSTYSGNRTSTAKEHKELVRVSSAFFHPAFKSIIFLAQFFLWM